MPGWTGGNIKVSSFSPLMNPSLIREKRIRSSHPVLHRLRAMTLGVPQPLTPQQHEQKGLARLMDSVPMDDEEPHGWTD